MRNRNRKRKREEYRKRNRKRKRGRIQKEKQKEKEGKDVSLSVLFLFANVQVFFTHVHVEFTIFRWLLMLKLISKELRSVFPFEQLEVYKKAFQANQKVYRLLKANKQIPPYAKNQLGRASLSIVLNIAEGSGKYSPKDRRNFYVTARGSVFECVSMICFLYAEEELSRDVKDDLYAALDEISRILYVMIRNLATKSSPTPRS